MPIVFQSAQPFDANAAYASGAAQNGPSMKDVLQALSIRQNAMNEQYATAASFASKDADRRQSGAELAMKLKYGQQQDINDTDARLTMQAGQLAQQQDQAQLHANVQMALQQGEFTHADKVQMDKLNYARSQVQTMLTNGDLTASEAASVLTQIKTGVDPYEAKMKATQSRVQQQKYQQLYDESQHLAGITSADAVTRSQWADRTMVRHPDTGDVIGMYEPGKGFVQLKPDHQGRDRLPPDVLSPQQYAGLQDKARRMTEQKVKAATEERGQATEGYNRDWWTDQRKQQDTANTLRDVFGVEGSYQQYLAARGVNRGQQPAATGGGNSATPAPPQPGPTPPPGATMQPVSGNPVPFDAAKPATEGQRAIVGAVQSFADQAAAAAPPDRKAEVSKLGDQLKAIAARNGGQAPPPDSKDYPEYVRIKAALRQVLPPPAPPPQQQPAPPAAGPSADQIRAMMGR